MIAIYGAGGFGREILSMAQGAAASSAGRTVFVSDRPGEIGSEVAGVPVLALDDLDSSVQVVIAVAAPADRRRLAERCEDRGLRYASLVHDNHVRGQRVEVGEGAVFCAFTTCTADLRIGRHFHANIYAYVAHDCVVGDFVTLAPRVSINGATVIEDDVYIGTGAVVRPGTAGTPLRIGAGAVIGMGAVVTRDVPPGVTLVGNPARPLVKGQA